MEWTVVEIPELRGYVVEWSEPGNYLLSRRNVIYRSADLRPPFERVAKFPSSSWRTTVSKLRLGQRLLRFSCNVVMPMANGDIFVSFDREIGVIRDGSVMRLAGLKRPCRILRSGATADRDGRIYFGEYFGNPEKEAVHIYRYTPGDDRIEIVHTFAPGEARHVHGVYRDEFNESLVCLTGDADSECRMLKTRDGFATIETIGSGDESWRAVSALFTDDSIYYGTDAEYRTNAIHRYDRASGERRRLGEVSGTVFYSHLFDGGKFFATTAENAPSQMENVAAIWFLAEDDSPVLVSSFPKDRHHTSLFGFGTIFFPHTRSPLTRLFVGVYATRGDSATLEIVRIGRE
ncbi:MAG: hypothetical protein ABIR33_11720 [Pyrinomonadaceae bacterium]